MNGFQLKEYWKYRRAAKGRHGVHSPAVYRFIDEALRPSARHFRNAAAYYDQTGNTWQADGLLCRIVQHFRFREIIVPSSQPPEEKAFRPEKDLPFDNLRPCFDRLYDWRLLAPETWMRHFRHMPAGDMDVIAVSGMHRSPQAVESWQHLIAQQEIRLSIDLFRIGLLFFSKDFKERQHFILKAQA